MQVRASTHNSNFLYSFDVISRKQDFQDEYIPLAIFAALVVGIVSGSNEPLCKEGDTFRMRSKASRDYVIYKRRSQAHQPIMRLLPFADESDVHVFCVHCIAREGEYKDVRIYAIFSGIYTDASETFIIQV